MLRTGGSPVWSPQPLAVPAFGQNAVDWSPLVEFGSALQLWLRADRGVTLSGGRVASWADQSGKGNNVSQGTVAYRPARVDSDARYNGQPTIDFVGGRLMTRATPSWGSLAQPFTWLVVGNNSGSPTYQVFFDSTTAARSQLVGLNATTYCYAGAFVNLSVSGAVKHAYACCFEAALSAIYVDNVLNASGNAGVLNHASLVVGGSAANLYSVDGPMPEIMLVSARPSVAQLGRFFNYAKARYATP